MRLSINTLEPEFSKEEWKLIKDYLKWVKNEMKHPQKPEIVIGGARYPLGRFTIRRGLIKPFRQKMEKVMENPIKVEKLKPIDEALSKVQTIVDELKQNGKTVNAPKRKNEDQDKFEKH